MGEGINYRCLCSFDHTLGRYAPRGEYYQRIRACSRLVMAEKSGRQNLGNPHDILARYEVF